MQNQCDGALRSMTSLYLFQGERILLLYRQGSRVVNEVWIASSGGHFEPEELNDARACVLRETREELGLSAEDLAGLRLGYITLRRIGGEIRQNYYFFAELKREPEVGLVSDEGRLQWFSFEELSTLPMPYTARYVLEHYLSKGRREKKLYAGVADADGVRFLELTEF